MCWLSLLRNKQYTSFLGVTVLPKSRNRRNFLDNILLKMIMKDLFFVWFYFAIIITFSVLTKENFLTAFSTTKTVVLLQYFSLYYHFLISKFNLKLIKKKKQRNSLGLRTPSIYYINCFYKIDTSILSIFLAINDSLLCKS